ncbi:SH3 domain-containing protein [Vibrio salinus]|uniref:SH3 domain-containing protein n=1 Tax=Vibrio salinus TaxID=2899784 RepID=UPI00356A04CD
MRNEPGHHGKVHGRFHGGQTVQVFAIIDGWAKVLFNGHYQWVSAEYLQPR